MICQMIRTIIILCHNQGLLSEAFSPNVTARAVTKALYLAYLELL